MNIFSLKFDISILSPFISFSSFCEGKENLKQNFMIVVCMNRKFSFNFISDDCRWYFPNKKKKRKKIISNQHSYKFLICIQLNFENGFDKTCLLQFSLPVNTGKQCGEENIVSHKSATNSMGTMGWKFANICVYRCVRQMHYHKMQNKTYENHY